MAKGGRVSRWLRRLLLVLALAFVAQYLAIALLRVRYPFALEWLEGAVLMGVERILSGQPLYTAPSIHWVPLLYTPLFSYLGAAVAALVGPSFAALRAVSIVSSLACFGLIYLIVERASGSRYAGAVGAGGALLLAFGYLTYVVEIEVTLPVLTLPIAAVGCGLLTAICGIVASARSLTIRPIEALR